MVRTAPGADPLGLGLSRSSRLVPESRDESRDLARGNRAPPNKSAAERDISSKRCPVGTSGTLPTGRFLDVSAGLHLGSTRKAGTGPADRDTPRPWGSPPRAPETLPSPLHQAFLPASVHCL